MALLIVLLVCERSVLPDLSLCLLSWPDSVQPFLCGPQLSGEIWRRWWLWCSRTWPHVVLVLMVHIVETGIYFPNGTRSSFTAPKVEVTFEVRETQRVDIRLTVMLTYQVVSTAVIFQLVQSMMILTPQWETQSIYVGLYIGSGDMSSAQWCSHKKTKP